MAGEKHLLLTAQGDYTDSERAAESWQVGLRLSLVFGTTDDVGSLPSNWDPSALNVNRTETDWTITGNWHVVKTPYSFQPDDYLNDIAAPAFTTWMGALPSLCTKTRLRSLKLYAIGTNGNAVAPPPYATGTPMFLQWTGSEPVGTNSGNPLPAQISAVASHRTPQTGRPGRGRMFIPGFTVSAVNAHGMFDTSWSAALAGYQRDLLEALALDGAGFGAPQIRPIVTGSGYTHYAVINQVKVGVVPDTQRRRRRSLDENYQSVTVTY